LVGLHLPLALPAKGKRHLLVDTEGLVLKAKVHSSAKVHDEDGIKLLDAGVRADRALAPQAPVGGRRLPRGRGRRRWAEETLGLSVEVVRKPPKPPVPEKVAKVWAEEWAKEGKEVDWQRLMPPRGFRVLPRVGGWWSAPSRGSLTTVEWARITKGCAPAVRPLSTWR
jgi:hypothetical protein